MRVHTTTNKIRHKIRHVIYNVRKQKTVENLKCANFMSISVIPSIDERVQRLPQQALQKSDTQESPMSIIELHTDPPLATFEVGITLCAAPYDFFFLHLLSFLSA